MKMINNLSVVQKKILQTAADVLSIFAAYLCSLLLRLGGIIPTEYFSTFLYTIGPIIVVHIVLY